MAITHPGRKWIKKTAIFFAVAVPACFFLAPFPFGAGVIFTIKDSLRGHPQRPHGHQPVKYVGLWVRDETEMYDFLGQAFCLLPDGNFAGMMGMTSRYWHYDHNRLYIDAVSHCGNCYQGNVTSEYELHFTGDNRLLILSLNGRERKGIGGVYRRVEIGSALQQRLTTEAQSADDLVRFKARMVLQAIKQMGYLSRPT